ncbi:MAG: ATP-dependent sacrificial sulfur transferase LarE [Deltaproteobacteria bacterium]|nr:ATP-dependent sacrificial sulfur transferase LarE [Deltaproteobacteria bacterium]
MAEKALVLKKEKLIQHLKGLNSVLVAFSGGVDSTFLLAVSHQVLGDRAVAATADSFTYPSREREEAIEFTRKRGISHIVFQSDESDDPDFLANNPERCYFCKMSLSRKLLEIASEKRLAHVAHATNCDDLGDYRPGLRAANEMGMIAPLLEAGINKEEIRFLSKEMGLPTWDKPAMACLASRIPYGDPITEKKLRMIEDAESFLQKNGFSQYRVRFHGNTARIEVEPSEIEMIIDQDLKKKIIAKFKDIGFLHIAVDLEGYVTGSLNRGIGIDVEIDNCK